MKDNHLVDMNIYQTAKLSLVGALLLALTSCGGDQRTPGRTFVPDMAYSQAYETYTKNPVFGKDSLAGVDSLAAPIAAAAVFISVQWLERSGLGWWRQCRLWWLLTTLGQLLLSPTPPICPETGVSRPCLGETSPSSVVLLPRHATPNLSSGGTAGNWLPLLIWRLCLQALFLPCLHFVRNVQDEGPPDNTLPGFAVPLPCIGLCDNAAVVHNLGSETLWQLPPAACMFQSQRLHGGNGAQSSEVWSALAS
jgi:hypothetical protein